MEFRTFLVENDNHDVKVTLQKLPASHRKLVKGWSFQFQGNNGLNGDPEHVGEVNEKTKKIKIAAPWNYARDFVLYHEIAHLVWKYLLDEKARNRWIATVKANKQNLLKDLRTKKQKTASVNQNEEELFCHSYAQFYCNHKLLSYNNAAWQKFIKNLPQ